MNGHNACNVQVHVLRTSHNLPVHYLYFNYSYISDVRHFVGVFFCLESSNPVSGMGNEYWPKCGNALWLTSKGRYG